MNEFYNPFLYHYKRTFIKSPRYRSISASGGRFPQESPLSLQNRYHVRFNQNSTYEIDSLHK
ncbi:hypothetical protein [Alteribacillus bidgolensis]|uniref:hypothetical protein n=1 Tax=Alteribacillus bidgolensis TaxID=930129 RepID=UPI0011134037|nr:hypothetical protein [Alteribacillus bidgolensis]